MNPGICIKKGDFLIVDSYAAAGPLSKGHVNKTNSWARMKAEFLESQKGAHSPYHVCEECLHMVHSSLKTEHLWRDCWWYKRKLLTDKGFPKRKILTQDRQSVDVAVWKQFAFENKLTMPRGGQKRKFGQKHYVCRPRQIKHKKKKKA